MSAPSNSRPKAFTGRTRRKKTSWTVKFSDVAARVLITVGGIGTIIAVCFVFIYLGYVVLPLFSSPSVGGEAESTAEWIAKEPVRMAIDEYRSMGWALYDDGELQVFRLDTGETIDRRQLFEGVKLTSASFAILGDDVALGFDDGSIRLGRIGFEATFRERQDMPEALKDLAVGDSATLEKGVVRRTPQGQLRLQKVVTELRDPVQAAAGPILRIHHSSPEKNAPLGGNEHKCCLYSADGKLQSCSITEKKNLFTGKLTLQNNATELPLASAPAGVPKRTLLAGRGDNVYAIWDDGNLIRYDVRNPSDVRVVEEVDLLPETDATLTICDFVQLQETLICGDSDGGLRAWFRVRRDEAEEPMIGDGFRMAMVHDLGNAGSPPRSFGPSQRSRMIAVGYEDGRVRVYHVTSEQLLLEKQVGGGRPINQVVIAPKDNGLFAATSASAWRCEFEPAHPEASVGTLFGAVWYEGYNEPLHIWQSSFAGVGPEMKLGLLPVVFGTIKATFYSMLFGAPLALLAAIYTSEFLAPRSRARIKPVIEMMASLPSVVLGFLAALVFAPWIENFVPAALTCFLTVPLVFLLASQLWHLIPYRIALRLMRYRFLFICLIMPLGLVAAWLLGPAVERLFFAGDIKLWLDGQVGNGVGAWMFLMLPACGFVALLFVTLYVNSWIRSRAHRWNRGQFALLNLGKFGLGLAFMFGAAYGLSYGLDAIGLDPRGTYVDTYEQRNALVVGFVMGFAIIPIIYTLSDDALTTVPNHLRSGSLGCGATPWQTTWTIVIPTAMSGLFSAMMIGLGRAVGETMIVLMAGGNTPVTEWNIFNGFRTLAANIAVELPEAVRDSTHYRTLFLAALTLFVMTFFINTFAEVVRLRFRRRAYQL
jgi:phosphate transport system permease protein